MSFEGESPQTAGEVVASWEGLVDCRKLVLPIALWPSNKQMHCNDKTMLWNHNQISHSIEDVMWNWVGFNYIHNYIPE